MKQFNYPSIEEVVYQETLDNGLTIVVLPKEKYNKFYVTLSTNFGSLHTSISNDSTTIELPDGIAHFLEHKLFERSNMDISKQFSMFQANVNAYTQHERTTYLFSATDHIYENISLLLDLVFTPEFSDKGIDKERDIITQEIKMYQDDPSSQLYNGMLDNLFVNHPIKKEILGTVDSIKQITKEILIQTHQAYYHPSNMLMFVTGNVEPTAIINHIKKNMPILKEPLFKGCSVPMTTGHIAKQEESAEYEIMIPNYLLGIKLEPCEDITQLMKKEITLSVLMDIVFGKSSENYQYLLENQLINDSFGMDISIADTYAYFLVGSETNHPEELHRILVDMLLSMNEEMITEEAYLKTKKQTIGGFIQALNSLEYIANNFTKYYYQDSSLFELLDVSRSITLQDVKDLIPTLQNQEDYTKYTIYPKKR